MKSDGIANGFVGVGKSTDTMDATVGGLESVPQKSGMDGGGGLRKPHPDQSNVQKVTEGSVPEIHRKMEARKGTEKLPG